MKRDKVRVKVDGMYLCYYPKDDIYTKTKNKKKATLFPFDIAQQLKGAIQNVILEEEPNW